MADIFDLSQARSPGLYRGQKLGRRGVKHDSRTLMASRYMKLAKLPPLPPAVDWTAKLPANLGMMMNDTLGDCTIAGLGHAVQVWTGNAGQMVTVPDSTILSAYESFDGYVPGNPATDQGGIELDVLNDFRAQGFGGYELTAFMGIVPAHIVNVLHSIHLFGGAYIGFEVPQFIMPADGSPTPPLWDVQPKQDDTNIGGHCVFVAGYYYDEATGKLCVKLISWGQVYAMTVDFWHQYVDEAYALLSPAWASDEPCPAGFDLTQLQADLAMVT